MDNFNKILVKIVVMKPIPEKIIPNLGSSFYIQSYIGNKVCTAPFWHIHPEYELVYIDKGNGQRHIGNHFSYYQDGDLILIGPNLPHSSFSNTDFMDNQEIVLQMNDLFVGSPFLELAEFGAIRELFQKSHQGLSFYGQTKVTVGKLLKEMVQKKPFDRLINLLEVLQMLARSNEYRMLQVSHMALEIHSQDYNRMNKVYDFITQHYHKTTKIEEVANLIHLTPHSFCRFFKKTTGKSFIQFLNEYRIIQACDLMYKERRSISEIMYAVGFNSLAHFNRQFKRVTGLSPKAYRESLQIKILS